MSIPTPVGCILCVSCITVFSSVTGRGTLYTSDSTGEFYTVSLENHLVSLSVRCATHNCVSYFSMKALFKEQCMISMRCSLPEVCISPVLRRTVRYHQYCMGYNSNCHCPIDNHITSRISFNRGATWTALKATLCVSHHL